MKNYFITTSVCLSLVTMVLTAQDQSIADIKNKLKFTQADLDERGRLELKGFVDSKVWQGGYYEGNPQNPKGTSSYYVMMDYYGQKVNPLFVCYSECIKPYINSQMDVLEIGPGQGAWSQSILVHNPKTLTCLDALTAEHNRFWQHVKQRENVKYIQVKDFLLNELKDNSIDFVFSFGTFCHISPLMCYEYFKNLFGKLRHGAHGFIMYADFDKKNRFAAKYNLPNQRMGTGRDDIAMYEYQRKTGDFRPTWYHLGVERAEAILVELGYEVINVDVNANERDPIVHFRKP